MGEELYLLAETAPSVEATIKGVHAAASLSGVDAYCNGRRRRCAEGSASADRTE